MAEDSEIRNMYGVKPCPWCGSKFRVVDPSQPNLIQCDDCRRDEKIDSSIVSAYERERLESMERFLTLSQLANLLQSNGLSDMSEDTIRLYAKAGTIPSVKIGNDLLFNPNRIAKWMRDLLKASTTPANRKPA